MAFLGQVQGTHLKFKVVMVVAVRTMEQDSDLLLSFYNQLDEMTTYTIDKFNDTQYSEIFCN